MTDDKGRVKYLRGIARQQGKKLLKRGGRWPWRLIDTETGAEHGNADLDGVQWDLVDEPAYLEAGGIPISCTPCGIPLAFKNKDGWTSYLRDPQEALERTSGVVVHNDPVEGFGAGRSCSWIQEPSDQIESCGCAWLPELRTHYRVKDEVVRARLALAARWSETHRVKDEGTSEPTVNASDLAL